MVVTRTLCWWIVLLTLETAADIDYDVWNGSVFEVAARLNGVPYIASKSVAAGQDAQGSSSSLPGIPSAASVKKVLPVFIILQLVFSIFTVGGAFWLVRDASDDKYSRVPQERHTTLIPARFIKHTKYDSLASMGSDTA